jgi:hypothetical protein
MQIARCRSPCRARCIVSLWALFQLSATCVQSAPVCESPASGAVTSLGASCSADKALFLKKPQAQGGTCCSSPWRAHCTLCAIHASLQVHNPLVLVLHHSAFKWVPEQCSPRTRANPSRQPLLGRCKKKTKSPNPMQSQAHAAVRPGGLTARCVQPAPVLASPPSTSAVRGTPIIVWHGWFAGVGKLACPGVLGGKKLHFSKV